jgi:serine/threonine protein kinase
MRESRIGGSATGALGESRRFAALGSWRSPAPWNGRAETARQRSLQRVVALKGNGGAARFEKCEQVAEARYDGEKSRWIVAGNQYSDGARMQTGAGSVAGQLGVGDTLGDYEILSVAGIGGMGVVYKARQRSLGRVVALKVIREEIARTPEYRDRFLREARMAASVDHPHVVSMYDVGAEAGQLFLSMQWIDGEDLKRVIQRSGPLALDRAVMIAVQLAGALDALHEGGMIHRDVKPANVLVRSVAGKDHAYLTDFGVAKPADTGEHLTNTGWIVGTTGYLSPEQIMGHEPGPRSDLYALGCLFFETLTGQQPFHGENEMAVRWAHANDPRPTTRDIAPSLGARYDEFFMVALAVDPANRFASGRELAHALENPHDIQPEIATTPIAAPPHPPTIIGPPTPISPGANTPPPTPPMYPGYGYPTPPSGYPQQPRSGAPLALILLGLVALAGIAVGALAAGGVFSHNSVAIPRTTTTSVARTQTTTASPTTGRTAASATTSTTARLPTARPPTAPSQSVPSAPAVTGSDTSGYNTGLGCSDNPASPLPGCADSPSVPNGDPEQSCPNGLTVDAQTTSCGLAERVYSNYTSDGSVTALSPERGSDDTFTCQTGGPGTTGLTICVGQAGGSPLYVRWHR